MLKTRNTSVRKDHLCRVVERKKKEEEKKRGEGEQKKSRRKPAHKTAQLNPHNRNIQHYSQGAIASRIIYICHGNSHVVIHALTFFEEKDNQHASQFTQHTQHNK
jgi:translation initiation factor 2B subunit (eIF-2B alpha/beta/delta family)